MNGNSTERDEGGSQPEDRIGESTGSTLEVVTSGEQGKSLPLGRYCKVATSTQREKKKRALTENSSILLVGEAYEGGTEGEGGTTDMDKVVPTGTCPASHQHERQSGTSG
jgi:hypothetical protein